MEARLATKLLVTGLLRLAESQGGFGAVLAKGDPTGGAILLILSERGGNLRILERTLGPDGRYSWQQTAPQVTENTDELANFLARRRRIDPDLWLIELDIASVERFAAEMNALD